jgi:DNA-binding NarL/FixJ family response regulator
MINVLLADDHELVREGIKQLLNGAKDIDVIVEASNGAEAVSKYRQFHTDIVILDISMPVLDGLEAAKQIMAEDPKAKILILTVHPEEQYAVRALKAGARGYITKGTTAKELYRAVRMVAHGQRYLSEGGQPSILTQLLDPKISLSPVQRLSDRELQVLRLIAEGVKTSEIARTLRLNTKTVETYRTRLMNKLDLKTNAALVLFAQRNGFV